MPIMSLTEIYYVTGFNKDEKDGNVQEVSLKAKYGDHHELKIKGIPSDVDLNGDVQVHTYHVDDLEDSIGYENKNKAEPDKIEVYQYDGDKIVNSCKLFKNPKGGYRRQTKDEQQKTYETNMGIINKMLGLHRR